MVPAENLYPKPARLSWHEAAAFPLAGLTAYRALFSRAGLRAGETVLVLGAGSGVSTFAVSLAHRAGARVLVTSSSGEKIERARSSAPRRGVDYTDGGWVDEVRARRRRGRRRRRRLGRDDLAGLAALPASRWPARRLRGDGGARRSSSRCGRSTSASSRSSARRWAARATSRLLLQAVDAGGWAPVVDSVRPLAEAAAAHARLEAGEHFGKLVLDIA